MIENVLVRKNVSLKVKITVKSIITAVIVLLAVSLPQLTHFIAGSAGGKVWNPMFLPVLLGACLLGWNWGLAIGLLSPITSFFVTSIFGNPMPALNMLPSMMLQLSTLAIICGLFSKKINENGWMAFAAVVLAHAASRIVYFLYTLIFSGYTSIWTKVASGFPGILAQIVLVPLIVMGIKYLLDLEEKKNK